MMELTLKREPSDDRRTFGALYIDGAYECETLEDVVREEKIKGETAIPAGCYRITMEHSPRFGPDTLTVNDVPNYTGVRIHAGNNESHTEGCPLVGQGRNAAGLVNSRPALVELKRKVSAGLQDGAEVWMTVENG